MHSRTYEDVGAAIESGLSPTAFALLEEQDQAYVLAYHRIKGTMMAYENYLSDRELQRKQRSSHSR